MALKKIKVRKVVDGKEVIEEIEVDEVEPSETDDEAGDEESEGGAGADDAGKKSDSFDYSDPEKAKAEIKRLRDENAKARIKNKETSQRLTTLEQTFGGLKKALGVSDDKELTPEELKAERERLMAERDALLVDQQLREMESEHSIPKEHSKYFRFLLNEKLESLEEGEELPQEDLEDIVKQVKSLGGTKKSGNSTGLNSGGAPSPKEGTGDLTVEDFAEMTLGERTALYTKNPQEYNRLFAAANAKGLL